MFWHSESPAQSSPSRDFLAAIESARRELVGCAQRHDKLKLGDVTAIEKALGDVFALFTGIKLLRESLGGLPQASFGASEIHRELVRRAMEAFRRREYSEAVRHAEIALFAAQSEGADTAWLTSIVVELMRSYRAQPVAYSRTT